MNARFAILSACALLLAAGCQKVPEPKTATRASGEGASVALPDSKASPGQANNHPAPDTTEPRK